MAGIYSDCSTHETIIMVYDVSVTVLDIVQEPV